MIYHDLGYDSEYISINQQPGYLLSTCICLEIPVDLLSGLFWRTLVVYCMDFVSKVKEDYIVLDSVRLDYQFAAGSIGYRKVIYHGMQFSGSPCTHTMALGITRGFPIGVLLSYGTPVRIKITYWQMNDVNSN